MRENAEKCSPQEAAMVPLQAQGGAGSGPLRAALCPPPPPGGTLSSQSWSPISMQVSEKQVRRKPRGTRPPDGVGGECSGTHTPPRGHLGTGVAGRPPEWREGWRECRSWSKRETGRKWGGPPLRVPAECQEGAGPGAAGRSRLLWGERAPLPRSWGPLAVPPRLASAQRPPHHARCPPLRRAPRGRGQEGGRGRPGPASGRLGAAAAPPSPNPLRKGRCPPPPRGGTCRRGGSPRRQRRGEGERCEVRGPSAAPLGSSGSPPAPSPPLFRSSPLASEGLGPAGPGPGLPQRTPSSPSHPAFREGAVHQGLRSPGTSGDLVRTRKRAHLLGAPRCQAWYRDALAQAVPRATPARPESQSLGARDP